MKLMLDRVREHKTGRPVGVASVCSAHPLVIEAAFRAGLDHDGPVLIEATSNQVNQYGGYTAMVPAQFRHFVLDIAQRVQFPVQRIVFGGDHLGPNCWQNEPAEQAMQKSEALIRAYVAAGFRKIHLDCSMSCADDPVPLPDHVVAQRAARLCAVSEQTFAEAGGDAPVYVVGTEVPVPGGAHEDLQTLQVTTPQAAAATIAAHQDAFAGLGAAWERVIALVVQPGVEFDHHKVIDYRPDAAVALSRFIDTQPGLVYEAHSTDYQTAANLHNLVRDHFAILKVGPGVTFALRETLWALADIEAELVGANGSGFKRCVLDTMRAQPQHWQKYYTSGERLALDLQYSLSDRIRYYWSDPVIQAAQKVMLTNLEKLTIPLTLISQYLPQHYALVRGGQLQRRPGELLIAGVAAVLRQYNQACAGDQENTCH